MRSIRSRRGIERVFVILSVLLLLLVISIALIVSLSQSEAARPKAAIVLGASTNNCSRISFVVENQDTRIFHGWSVVPVITPTDSHIRISPDNYSIEVLGPRGNSTQRVFDVSLSGAPTGVYNLELNLVNGSSTIATSPSISCNV